LEGTTLPLNLGQSVFFDEINKKKIVFVLCIRKFKREGKKHEIEIDITKSVIKNII